MIVVALLLLVVAAAAVLFIAVTGSAEPVRLVWDAVSISWAPTALAVFLLGAAVMLVAEAGVGLLLRGNRKNWQRRQELKRLRKVASRQSTAAGAPDGGYPAAGSAAPAAAPTAPAPAATEPGSGGAHRS